LGMVKRTVVSMKPSKSSEEVPQPEDPQVERLRSMATWQVAYCRDVTKCLDPAIVGRGIEGRGTMVGRAYTVSGGEVYLDALEGVTPGSVWVQGGCDSRSAVFSPGWTHAYIKPRGGVGVVVDGGIYKAREASTAACHMFSAFVSPSPAINRRNAIAVGDAVSIGGVEVRAGDIVMGDSDGIVVIPKTCEAEFFAGLEGFLEGNGMFGKIAARALQEGIPLTEEPALADMFERKYQHPESYWRHYAPWWGKWRCEKRYQALSDATAAFYSGGASASSPPAKKPRAN